MALFPWRKKKNDSIHLAHGGPADPSQSVANDPITGFGPSGDTPFDPIRNDHRPVDMPPNTLPEHGPDTTPPATGVLPTGEQFPGNPSAGPPSVASAVPTPATDGNTGDTPSDPTRIMNPNIGETPANPVHVRDPLNNGSGVNHQHDQHWWASHYPHTIHDADGGPRPRDDLAKSTPIQVNVSDGTENKPAGVSLGGESINVSSGVTDPAHQGNDSLKPWGGDTMPNDAMGLSPHPEDKG